MVASILAQISVCGRRPGTRIVNALSLRHLTALPWREGHGLETIIASGASIPLHVWRCRSGFGRRRAKITQNSFCHCSARVRRSRRPFVALPIRRDFGRQIVITNGQYRFLVAEQLAAMGADADIL